MNSPGGVAHLTSLLEQPVIDIDGSWGCRRNTQSRRYASEFERTLEARLPCAIGLMAQTLVSGGAQEADLEQLLKFNLLLHPLGCAQWVGITLVTSSALASVHRRTLPQSSGVARKSFNYAVATATLD
jgi:hypothetical protein